MECTGIQLEALAYCAGAIISAAGLPQIWSNMTDPEAAKKQSISRNVMILTGNVAWTYYGYVNGLQAIPVFCSITAGLTGVLLIQQLSRKAWGKPA